MNKLMFAELENRMLETEVLLTVDYVLMYTI